MIVIRCITPQRQQWMRNINLARAPNWLLLIMLGFCSVHNWAKSRHHAHQEHTHIKWNLTKENDNLRSLFENNWHRILALALDQIQQLVRRKDFKKPIQAKDTQNIVIFECVSKYLHSGKRRGNFDKGLKIKAARRVDGIIKFLVANFYASLVPLPFVAFWILLCFLFPCF